MYIKIMHLSLIFTFLFFTNNAIGKGPGSEEWIDEKGSHAPPIVRQAADDLWDVVANEGIAANNAGWGQKEKLWDDCCCWTVSILSCGLIPCIACCAPGDDGDFLKKPMSNQYEIALNQIDEDRYNQKTKEVNQALEKFKDAVNKSVLKPESYSGDANICNLGSWIVDDASTAISTDYVSTIKYNSCHRDLSRITAETKSFVNKHGGWIIVNDNI
jgi:hypothetical protein